MTFCWSLPEQQISSSRRFGDLTIISVRWITKFTLTCKLLTYLNWYKTLLSTSGQLSVCLIEMIICSCARAFSSLFIASVISIIIHFDGISRITQPEPPSPAMRNLSGHYYLNGDWRVAPPSSEPFAGTLFHYERGRAGFFGPERLRALGPTSEPLYLVVSFRVRFYCVVVVG